MEVKTARKPTGVYEEAWDSIIDKLRLEMDKYTYPFQFARWPEDIMALMEKHLKEARQRRDQTRLELRNKHTDESYEEIILKEKYNE